MQSNLTYSLAWSLRLQLDVAGHCLVESICSAVCFVDSIVHACFSVMTVSFDLTHSYQLGHSMSVLRFDGWYFTFIFKF